ncbi:hypothetical protein EG831_06535 [bacterium]|nr:hypothetical protein [bacterium]
MGGTARYYQIRVEEPLEDCWREWFRGLEIQRCPNEDGTGMQTLLCGTLPDQAALFGVLAVIRDLNLTLLAVTRQ